MKKIYFLLLCLSITATSLSQVIITEIADPDNDAGARFVELYNVGSTDQDLTGWELRRWTNANTAPQNSGIDLTPIGTLVPGTFAIIAANGTQFQTVYGIAANISGGTGGAADSNGDDKIALFDENDVTIDIYGTPGVSSNNTSSADNFEDGRTERVATILAPNATWTASEWNTDNDQGFGDGAQDAPSGFDPGAWIGQSNACGASLGAATFTCSSNTIGDNNDGVIIEITYTGSDAGITSVTTTSAGIVGGDDPASVVSGTITITGLSEGDAWDLVLNGGDCDTNSTSGTVPANECDPDPNTCFDISTGAELFELVIVTPNSQMDEWANDAGTYSMNGFVDGAQEQVEAWLIFGPLDTSSSTDLSLAFNAVENFGTTDLVVAYTALYAGCPSDTSWTTAETLTAAGPVEVDLSAASGTEVYIGIQYLDDGVDGYSGWELSNVALEAFGACPTLGTRTPSICVTCELTLGANTATCDTNTAGTDTYTVTLAFTGGATSSYIVSADSGVVAGDDPNVVASGIISVTGLNEGTDVVISIIDQGGICNLQTTITSPTCLEPLNCPNPGDILITEIMQNPSINGDPAGEYFEVFNPTGTAIDMIGWIIKDDETTSENHTIATSLIVPSNGYLIIANGATPNGGLAPDYTYGNDISLANGVDGIILECSGSVIDQVIYDDGATFPDPTGASMELSSTLPAGRNNIDNDDGANWGVATMPFGDGDLGTPGAVNNFTLSNDNFDVNGFSIYPNPTATGFVNIKANVNGDISISVFNVLGKQIINQKLNNERLDVSSLKAGIYIMRISQDNNTATKKLIIK